MPGPTFGFVKLLASSGSHCTKWADEQHRQAGFESRLVPDLPLLFIPTLIGLRAFDLVSSRVWWEAATNTGQFRSLPNLNYLFVLCQSLTGGFFSKIPNSSMTVSRTYHDNSDGLLLVVISQTDGKRVQQRWKRCFYIKFSPANNKICVRISIPTWVTKIVSFKLILSCPSEFCENICETHQEEILRYPNASSIIIIEALNVNRLIIISLFTRSNWSSALRLMGWQFFKITRNIVITHITITTTETQLPPPHCAHIQLLSP